MRQPLKRGCALVETYAWAQWPKPTKTWDNSSRYVVNLGLNPDKNRQKTTGPGSFGNPGPDLEDSCCGKEITFAGCRHRIPGKPQAQAPPDPGLFLRLPGLL